jgi:hypothetical protein
MVDKICWYPSFMGLAGRLSNMLYLDSSEKFSIHPEKQISWHLLEEADGSAPESGLESGTGTFASGIGQDTGGIIMTVSTWSS